MSKRGPMKQRFREAADIARLQWMPFAAVLVLLAAFYTASVYITPGRVTYWLSVPPAVVIAITALARVNDIGPERMSRRWHVRRVGLILAGAGAVMVMASALADGGTVIAWRTVVLVWGVALAWLTTPEMPPWHDYITGKYRSPGPDGSKFNHFDNLAGRRTGQHDTQTLRRRMGDVDGD